jgi:hypothetical protein
MICHVLEHVADPVSFLTDAGSHIRNGGFVLISLPCEWFSLMFTMNGPVAKNRKMRYLSMIQKLPFFEKVIDFYSTLAKIKLHLIPPFGFVKQSEHLTIFNKTAIARMVERSGFVLQGDITIADNAIFGQEYICVARKTANRLE